MKAPTAEDFQNALDEFIEQAQADGKAFVDVQAGELHREVGGYPGPDHRMPVCCSVMRKTMTDGDVVLSEPPKGVGASLKIRYRLPR